MRHLIFFTTVLLAALCGNCQLLTHSQLSDLSDRLLTSIIKADKSKDDNQPAEYIQCIIRLDSTGKVSSMHLLADPKINGVIYSLLNKVPLSVFDGYKVEKAKNHTIILPVAYLPHEGFPDHIRDLIKSRGDNSVYFTIQQETYTTILLTTYIIEQGYIYFNTPTK